jgi:hypothetical protein
MRVGLGHRQLHRLGKSQIVPQQLMNVGIAARSNQRKKLSIRKAKKGQEGGGECLYSDFTI